MIGQTISHYRILSELGAGGMGVVYRAEDLTLRRPVAIKFLTAHLSRDSEARARFLHEAQAAAGLDHEGICTVYESGEDGGQLFIAMALLEGRTLKERIAAGPLPIAEAVGIAAEVAEALHEAHGKGVVHRDIKPANIMLTPRGRAKVMDFGLAQVAEATQLTRSRTTLGTVAYMSPEQASGGSVDARTDIWSLGVVLYEMIAGRRPFAGGHDVAVLNGIRHDEPARISSQRAGLPAELEGIVSRCLAKDVASRYRQSAELARDLRAVLARLDSTSEGNTATVTSPERGASPAPSRQPRTTLRLLVAASVVLTVATALAIRGLGDRRASSSARHAIASLAVLPFENIGGDAGQEYLVEGMHEALITDLSRGSDLKVISRTSVMRYRGASASLPDIAAELRVDGIIEGSVMRAGDRVRITAHLVDAASDRQLWAQSYERDMTEILRLQREVAQAIVAEVGAAIRPGSQTGAGPAPSIVPEAYEAYIRGRYHWNRRARADMLEAIEQFRRAIRLAPGFAEAHAGLADVYGVAGVNNDFPPAECYPLAREEATRALTLNEELAQAHVSLAFVQLYYDMDREGAERSYRTALSLDPNYAAGRQWYAIFLEQDRRFTEALEEIERARMLDPMSAIMNANVARRYAIAGRSDQALSAIDRAMQLDPELPFVLSVLGEICFLRGDYRREAELIARLDASAGMALLSALESGGRKGYLGARLRLARGNEPLAGKHVGLLEVSCLTQLGEIDEACQVVASWQEERRSWLQWLGAYPTLDPLREDPRCRELMRKAALRR
jgi:serine/threonine-protein kinase